MANTTWNLSDKDAAITLSGSNLIATTTAIAPNAYVRAIDRQISGKFYWENKPTVWSGGNTSVGFCSPALVAPTGNTAVGICSVFKTGNIWVNGATTGLTLGTRAANDVIGIAVDFTARLVWFRVAPSGNWNGSATANPATGVEGVVINAVSGGAYPGAPLATFGGVSGDSITANFGNTAFTGAVPAGFTSGFTAGASTLNSAVATQAGLEHFYATNPDAQITQTALEMWTTTATVTGQAIVTLAALEMWAPAIDRTGKIKVWNGSAWIPKDVLSIRAGGTWDAALWDASYWAPDSWRAVPVKVWKGSSWQLAR